MTRQNIRKLASKLLVGNKGAGMFSGKTHLLGSIDFCPLKMICSQVEYVRSGLNGTNAGLHVTWKPGLSRAVNSQRSSSSQQFNVARRPIAALQIPKACNFEAANIFQILPLVS